MSLSRNDLSLSSSSFIKSEAGSTPRNTSYREKPIPKISNRQSTISRLTQPKGSQMDSPLKERHIRSKEIHTQDIFENFDEQSEYNSFLPKIRENTTNDKRFQRLMYLFADCHERDPATVQSIQTLVKSNASLQTHLDSREKNNVPLLPPIHQEENFDDSFNTKSEMSLIDRYV